jgi:hypothetical protein
MCSAHHPKSCVSFPQTLRALTETFYVLLYSMSTFPYSSQATPEHPPKKNSQLQIKNKNTYTCLVAFESFEDLSFANVK